MATVESADGTRTQLSSEEVHKATDTQRWYKKEISIPVKAQELLENYSGLGPDEVQAHVEDIRKRAFQEWPYPCIGLGSFLELVTSTHSMYPEIVARLQRGQTFLDAGCCFGQDLRKLLFDGAPSSAALTGIDLVPGYFTLGRELFRDGDRLQSRFLAVDLTRPGVLEENEGETAGLAGAADVVGVQNVVHLFGWEDGKQVVTNLIAAARPVAGSLICGRQIGSTRGEEHVGLVGGSKLFLHNENTWKKLWDEAMAETSTKWKLVYSIEKAPASLKAMEWWHDDFVPFSWSATREA